MATLIEVVARQAHHTFSKNVGEEAFTECFNKLKRLVAQVRSSDINLSRDVLNKSRKSVFNFKTPAPVTYIEIAEDQVFSMGVFVLKVGSRIPLHDHPTMHGLLKVIHGTLRIVSYSVISDGKSGPVPPDVLRKVKSWQKDMLYQVRQEDDVEINEESEACILTPSKGNLHEISSVGGPAAFLDILAPPYDMKERDCHYYMPLKDQKTADSSLWVLRTPPPSDFWCDSSPYTGPSIHINTNS